MHRLHPLNTPLILLLAAALSVSGCASLVQIRPPYEQKLRIGDDVDVTVEGKSLHGSVVYLDANGLVIKTGKVMHQYQPVKAYTFTTQLSWAEIRNIRVGGILDRRGKLISDEEIKVNRRTDYRRMLPFNLGLLGCAASFGLGVTIQDRYFPPLGQKPLSSLNKGRGIFWMTWMGGTMLSTAGGYLVGRILDRHHAIQRVERIRAAENPSYSQAQDRP